MKILNLANESLVTNVIIDLPTGFDRDRLDYNALDSHSRNLAKETSIRVEGKILPCMSFRVKENGNLMLEVQSGFYKLEPRNDDAKENL